MTTPASSMKSISISDPVLADLMDQLANRLQAGEPVDVEEFIRAYPERAEELRRLLPAVEVLATLERSVDAGAISFPPGVEPSGSPSRERERPEAGLLGDFRIVGEVGRGGMGIVYEAVQISLNRRVALKVLPFAAAMDAKQLQRFKNEAQAAAHLQHTNIVPVHYVGCERGVHYYAMQFIEGQTLAALIGELRRQLSHEDQESRIEGRQEDAKDGPTTVEDRQAEKETVPVKPRSAILHPPSSFFRTVAHLGIQAAEALEYAHQMGIIHRDIKPGNLLIENSSPSPPGGEGRGEGAKAAQNLRLWITDFGLAHCQSHAGLTMTGDLMGTLRYMSPEQALAKRVVIDHRTDIYSLGLTLYELLTLEPAFNETDRAKLLNQIAFQEPPPIRRLRPNTPGELETIVMKAIEKEPQDRYATAQELANDLRSFLQDKPIRARKPSLRQRITKWTRRHPSVVWAGVSGLMIAVVALSISTFFIAQAQARTEAALKEAKGNYEAAEGQRQKALQNEASARQERVRAEENFRKACDWVVEMLQDLEGKELQEIPQIDKIRQIMFEKALRHFNAFTVDYSIAPRASPDIAGVFMYVGLLQADYDKSQEAFAKAIALWNQFATDHPEDSLPQRELGQCYNILGDKLFAKGLPREATAKYSVAGKYYRRAVQLNPADVFACNYLVWHLANCPIIEFRDPPRALELAKELVNRAPNSAGFWRSLGLAHYRAGEWKAAIAPLETSLKMKPDYCLSLFLLAMAHEQIGEHQPGQEYYDKGLQLMKENPKFGEFETYRAEAAALLRQPKRAAPSKKGSAKK